jgi:serine protease
MNIRSNRVFCFIAASMLVGLLPFSPAQVSAVVANSDAFPEDLETVVQEITVRYKENVPAKDAEGKPTATSGVDDVLLSFARTYPNNVIGLSVSPALSRTKSMQVAAEIMATGLVEFAEPLFPLTADAEPNQWHTCGSDANAIDTCIARQSWYTTAVRADVGWADSQANSPYAVVAVVDSGKLDHPDLVANLLPGRDFLDRSLTKDLFNREYDVNGLESGGDGDGVDADATDHGQGRNVGQCKKNTYTFDSQFDPTFDDAPAVDSNWHGTAVGSIIAGVRGNDVGISGIAPNVKILPVRVLGRCVEADDPMNLVRGIRWAAGLEVNGNTNPNPAHIINLSLGSSSPYCPTVYEEAINEVTALGVLVVASAGNKGGAGETSAQHTPGNCPNVISVGATNVGNTRADYSNLDANLSVPGGQLEPGDYSGGIVVASNTETRSLTTPSYSYKLGQGTSYAAPIVSAMAALAKTKYRSLTPAKIKAAMLYAASLGTQCTNCGAGIVSIDRFLNVLIPTAPPSVAQSIVAQGGPFTAQQGRVQWAAPITNTWNPVSAYVANAYSSASGGTPIATCSPTSLAQLSCNFEGLTDDTEYFASVSATNSTSVESSRQSFRTFRKAASPSGVTVTAGNRATTVAWNEVTDYGDFSGFGLYEAVAYSSQNGDTVAGRCYGNSSCEITDLTGGVQYWVSVAVMTGQHPGGSLYSTRVAVTPTGSSSSPGSVPSSNNNVPPNNPVVSTPSAPTTAVAPFTLTSSVGKKISSSVALKTAGIKSVKGGKISMTVSSKLKRICTVSGTTVKMVGKGTCVISVSMKPPKGKTLKKTIKVTATK